MMEMILGYMSMLACLCDTSSSMLSLFDWKKPWNHSSQQAYSYYIFADSWKPIFVRQHTNDLMALGSADGS